MLKKLLPIILLTLFFIYWSNDPTVNTLVTSSTKSKGYMQMAAGSQGGVLMTWVESKSIYLQRLSATGQLLSGSKGIKIYTDTQTAGLSEMASDGAGGYYFVVDDKLTISGNKTVYDYYVVRINSTGTVLWISDKIPSCAYVNANGARVAPDGKGGVFVAWYRYADPSNPDYLNGGRIFLQHLDKNGQELLANAGKSLGLTSVWEIGDVISDGQNGLFVSGERDGKTFLQRYNWNGNPVWSANGVELSDDSGDILDMQLDNQKGVYVAYENIYGEMYIQRVNQSGNKLFGTYGTLLQQGEVDTMFYGQMVLSPSGGVYLVVLQISHYATTSGYSWGYYHHVNTSGTDTTGGGIFLQAGYLLHPGVVKDSQGKAIVVIKKPSTNTAFDQLIGYKFNSSGTSLWPSSGVVISNKGYDEDYGFWGTRLLANTSGGAVVGWMANKSGSVNDEIYAQNVCAEGGLGNCASPVAIIKGEKFGGIAPAKFTFDGTESFDPDGSISRYKWDLGDGTESSSSKVTHTYAEGIYKVTLRVKDNTGNWSDTTTAYVKAFAKDALIAEFTTLKQPIKARKRGIAAIQAMLYDYPKRAGERPIFIDLGLTFTTNLGTWQSPISFGSKQYYRPLVSQNTGVATVQAKIQDTVVGSMTVQFDWLAPPTDVKVNFISIRSLFRGEKSATVTWKENSSQTFIPVKYYIYRSINGGKYTKVGEVNAKTFTFQDSNLTPTDTYSYAVTMLDGDGDESDQVIATVF